MRKAPLLPVSVLVICVLCISLSACSSGPQAPQPIEDSVGNYYQALEKHAYDDILDHLSNSDLTIDGQICFSVQGDIPLLRSHCEGLLFQADQTKGDVSNYSITQYTQYNDFEAEATINVTRDGKTYQERLGFIKGSQGWLIRTIDGL